MTLPTGFTASRFYREVHGPDAAMHAPSWRAVLAQLGRARAGFDRQDVGSWFGGDPERLGYDALGPLLLAFASWIDERARALGVRRLYFLARDGRLPLVAYRRLARVHEHAIEGRYLLCSRRATNVAGTFEAADVHDRWRSGIPGGAVAGFVRGRLGMEPQAIDAAAYRAAGLTPETRLTSDDALRLEALCDAAMDAILAHAAEERAVYLDYLRREGALEGDAAIVDLGYQGTLQESLARLRGGAGSLAGLYLVTFRAMRERVIARGMQAEGFLASLIDRYDSSHPYVRFVPLFESLFSTDETSFLRMERDEAGAPRPLRAPRSESDARRVQVVSAMQRGALAFVDDMIAEHGAALLRMDLEPQKAMRGLVAYFERPYADDARILQGIEFEDAYGGGGVRPIVPDDAALLSAPCLWEQGRMAIAYARRGDPLVLGVRLADGLAGEAIARGFARYVERSGSPRQAAKLWRDPARFVSDSSSRWVRAFGHVYLRRRGHGPR